MKLLMAAALLLTGCTHTSPSTASGSGKTRAVEDKPGLGTPETVGRALAGTRPAVTRRATRTRHTEPPSRLDLLDWTRTLDVTAYTWTGHRTASGLWPAIGMAASNEYPLGTRLRVEGIGVVTVQDRIGNGSQLDIYMDSREECLRFGRRRLRVAVVHR